MYLMARKGYTTIALPDELVLEIDSVIKKKVKGYSSRGEFCKEAIRIHLDRLKTK